MKKGDTTKRSEGQSRSHVTQQCHISMYIWILAKSPSNTIARLYLNSKTNRESSNERGIKFHSQMHKFLHEWSCCHSAVHESV